MGRRKVLCLCDSAASAGLWFQLLLARHLAAARSDCRGSPVWRELCLSADSWSPTAANWGWACRNLPSFAFIHVPFFWFGPASFRLVLGRWPFNITYAANDEQVWLMVTNWLHDGFVPSSSSLLHWQGLENHTACAERLAQPIRNLNETIQSFSHFVYFVWFLDFVH